MLVKAGTKYKYKVVTRDVFLRSIMTRDHENIKTWNDVIFLMKRSLKTLHFGTYSKFTLVSLYQQ